MTEDLPVSSWLDKPFWPWPIALAYSQSPAVREAALQAAVEILELYPRINWTDHAGVGAIHRIYEVMTDTVGLSRVEEDSLRRIEGPLFSAIHARKITGYGRKTPASLLEEIMLSAWSGSEIDGRATCDLVKAGWREKSADLSALLGEIQRVVWFFDVHLPRAEMIAAFGAIPPSIGAVPEKLAEPWSEEEMKREIAACSVSNRERAWRDIFEPRRQEHGWDNESFRRVWSTGRGTRGMTGRHAKRA